MAYADYSNQSKLFFGRICSVEPLLEGRDNLNDPFRDLKDG